MAKQQCRGRQTHERSGEKRAKPHRPTPYRCGPCLGRREQILRRDAIIDRGLTRLGGPVRSYLAWETLHTPTDERSPSLRSLTETGAASIESPRIWSARPSQRPPQRHGPRTCKRHGRTCIASRRRLMPGSLSWRRHSSEACRAAYVRREHVAVCQRRSG
jgi:hypothetical protein